MSPKCPKCEGIISAVEIHKIPATLKSSSWNGVAYACPLCHSILSVQIDPVAVSSDLSRSIAKKFETLEEKLTSEIKRSESRISQTIQSRR